MSAAGLRCAVCHGPARGALRRCPCGSLAHRECRDELRRCPTLGCRAPARPVGSQGGPGWGDELGAWLRAAGGLLSLGLRALCPTLFELGLLLLAISVLVPTFGDPSRDAAWFDRGRLSSLSDNYLQQQGRLPASIEELPEGRPRYAPNGELYHLAQVEQGRLLLWWRADEGPGLEVRELLQHEVRERAP